MRHFLLMTILAAGVALPATAQESDARIKELALEAILENPEIIAEAIQILQDRQREEEQNNAEVVFQQNKEVFLSADNAPILGNPEGEITIVEFFDYNCSYCRRAFEAVREIIDENSNVRVVMREFPILGEGSDYAARVSLAAMKQGKYAEFHWALMDDSIAAYSIKEDGVMKVARDVGMDMEQLKADMSDPSIDEHINATRELAQAVGFNGTPAFIIADRLVPGFVDKDVINQIIAEAEKG
ncbi:MAG: DsbA family protein [Pseudomonadota bacterium]